MNSSNTIRFFSPSHSTLLFIHLEEKKGKGLRILKNHQLVRVKFRVHRLVSGQGKGIVDVCLGNFATRIVCLFF